jgi:hypothetical protein
MASQNCIFPSLGIECKIISLSIETILISDSDLRIAIKEP